MTIKKAAPLPEQSSVMIGLFLSSRDQLALLPTPSELPDGATREDMMHITLAYYGDSVGQDQKDGILEAVECFSNYSGPIDVAVDGIGVFKNDSDVYYANVTSSVLGILRDNLLMMVKNMAGVDVEDPPKEFTPHITLFYAPAGASTTVTVPEMSIRFAQITVAIGNEHYVYPLSGVAIAEAISEYMNSQDSMGMKEDMGMSSWTLAKKTAEDGYSRIIKDVVNGTYVPPQNTQYVWVGIATNAYKDRTEPPFNILPLKSLQDDIERKALAIKQGASPHYGLLDVMHEHEWTIGVCQGRAIVEDTRMEMDWGYIDPEYNDLAKTMVDEEFTMSHETMFFIASGEKKFHIPKTLSNILIKTRLSSYLWLDTFRFTVARKGVEANERTYFKIYEIRG